MLASSQGAKLRNLNNFYLCHLEFVGVDCDKACCTRSCLYKVTGRLWKVIWKSSTLQMTGVGKFSAAQVRGLVSKTARHSIGSLPQSISHEFSDQSFGHIIIGRVWEFVRSRGNVGHSYLHWYQNQR